MRMLIGGGVLAVVIGATVVAQDLSAQSPTSLAALTEEVRLLRVAVEKSTQTQTQIQGIGVYLSAQQSRLLQAGTRVDALRKDLATAIREAGAVAEQAAKMRSGLETMPAGEMHDQMQYQATALAREAARAAEAETDLRAREAEASADLQTELARWSELTARLEQLIRQ